MQRTRFLFCMMAVLLVLTVSLWNKSNVWASPDQSPVRQTIPELRIDVEKYVKNGAGVWKDADTATGPTLNPGVNPQFKFVVTNIGNVSLTGLTLKDNVLNLSGCSIPSTLTPNGSFDCFVTGTWAAGQHTNKATATGTFSTAVVIDTDYGNYFGVVPVVSKTANGTYQEVHDWKIFKSVDPGSPHAFAGQKVNFTWTVSVHATTRSENHLVSGVIKVVNPNPDDPMSMSLNDTLNDGAVATIGPCTGGTWSSPNLTVPAGGTATCAYSVIPKGTQGNLDLLAAALPDTVTMSVHHGDDSYWDVTISNDGALNGTSEGWCVDGDHGIGYDKNYTAKVYSSYETLPAGLVAKPENFGMVNWILNQGFVGKPAGGGLGNYTVGDVQQAIWESIGDNTTLTSISYNAARVAQIMAAAVTHKDFIPTCRDFVALVLQPVGGQQITIAQVTFASLGVDCAKSNAVLAVLNGNQFPASAEILWTATPVNPTATLDDSQNPAWPTTVSADATFTYADPQGYTCSTNPAAYTNGTYIYNESNEAVLTFSSGSATSTASIKVTCGVNMPALSIVKTATPATYSQVGDVIHYSYLVKNTGNVTFAGPVTVSDDKTAVTCPAGGLVPNATMTCTAPYTITQADLDYGLLENTAFASANGTTSNTDDETVTANRTPALSIVKTATPETYSKVGEVISYSYLVKNTGNVTLNGPVTVSDDKATATCPAGSLAPDSTMTCTASYTIKLSDLYSGIVTNTAQAYANGTYSNTDVETVTFNGSLPYWTYLPLVLR